jgi:hypothetical protein
MLESAPGICTMDRLASPISIRATITATIANLEREDDAGTVLGIASNLPLLSFGVGHRFGHTRSPIVGGSIISLMVPNVSSANVR